MHYLLLITLLREVGNFLIPYKFCRTEGEMSVRMIDLEHKHFDRRLVRNNVIILFRNYFKQSAIVPSTRGTPCIPHRLLLLTLSQAVISSLPWNWKQLEKQEVCSRLPETCVINGIIQVIKLVSVCHAYGVTCYFNRRKTIRNNGHVSIIFLLQSCNARFQSVAAYKIP